MTSRSEIFLDIETVPTDRLEVKDYLASKVTHPGNISKAETIAKWNMEQRPQAIEEAVEKTSLDGAFGRVVCVGIAFDDSEPETICSSNEREVLEGLSQRLSKIRESQYMSQIVIGHNVLSFDLRFLVQRHMINGIQPHMVLRRSADAKPWDFHVYDTMLKFAGVGNRISLEKLLLAFGLPPKSGKGSDVWTMFQNGQMDEISSYCADDVRLTRALYKRMTFQ